MSSFFGKIRRRQFLSGLGMGVSGMALGASPMDGRDAVSPWSYGPIEDLKDALNEEGLICVRVAFTPKTEDGKQRASCEVVLEGGVIQRVGNYFYEGISSGVQNDSFQYALSPHGVNVVAMWIRDAHPQTVIRIRVDRTAAVFTLRDLVKNSEVNRALGVADMTANLLLYREIGSIRAADVGVPDPGDAFRMVVMADPQGGDPGIEGNVPTRMKIHNAWIEESVRQTNRLKPLCTLVLGDIVDSQGQTANYRQMAGYLRRLRAPVLYALGNHETRYNSTFAPGYNMSAFANYMAAQKKINGLDLLLYSFNLGQWHFIVWPDPLRTGFWETHPHYFDWLERDLARHQDRPTIFFQHVPVHPVGIDPLVDYVESVDVKRTLLDILCRHGNVRYVFSGHVHIPVRASFKTAVSYRGMNMINLPPAGYRPRGFGEPDFHGGPTQGILCLDFEGIRCVPTFRTVTEEEYTYPEHLPVFEEHRYRLWLHHKWELPVAMTVRNGRFEHGLDGWTPRYVYPEDDVASNRCAVVEVDGVKVVWLVTKKRGYDAPGQDRLPQTINRICQAVQLRNGGPPALALRYRIDPASDVDGWCGAFVWIEGFDGPLKKMDLVYSSGCAIADPGGRYERSSLVDPTHLGLPDAPGVWHRAIFSPAHDCRQAHGLAYDRLNLDRWVLNIGVWTINDAADYPYGIQCTDIALQYPDPQRPSQVDDVSVRAKEDSRIWWRGKYLPFDHVAGEHRYILGSKEMGPGT